MKFALWLLLDLVLAVAVSAQNLPVTPEPKVIDAKYLSVFAALAGAQLADGISTQQALDRGCVELNPVLGHHPGSVRLYLGGLALFAGEALAGYEMKKHHKKWWIQPFIAASVHGSLAFHNTRLTCRTGAY